MNDDNLYYMVESIKALYDIPNHVLEALEKSIRADERDKIINKIVNLRCYCEVCAFEGDGMHSNDKDILIKLNEIKEALAQDSQEDEND